GHYVVAAGQGRDARTRACHHPELPVADIVRTDGPEVPSVSLEGHYVGCQRLANGNCCKGSVRDNTDRRETAPLAEFLRCCYPSANAPHHTPDPRIRPFAKQRAFIRKAVKCGDSM